MGSLIRVFSLYSSSEIVYDKCEDAKEYGIRKVDGQEYGPDTRQAIGKVLYMIEAFPVEKRRVRH